MFFLLLLSLTNIFFPFVRRVGVLFFTSRGSGAKRRPGGQRRNAAQRKVAGRESRRGECQNALGFCFGAKAALRPCDRPSRGGTAPTRAQRSEGKTRSQPLGSWSQCEEKNLIQCLVTKSALGPCGSNYSCVSRSVAEDFHRREPFQARNCARRHRLPVEAS